jgi:hypothetical protein
MVLIGIAAAVAVVVFLYVVWRVWPERANPPWGMSEFDRRTGREPPRRSEKLDRDG